MASEFKVGDDSTLASVAGPSCSSNGTLSIVQPLLHKSSVHGRLVLAQLAELRDSAPQLCDVILRVGSISIAAHRLVLSACSAYFRAMFTNEMAESRQHEIQLVDIDPKTLQLLVDFCYTGEIRVTEQNVQLLLPAACHFQLNEVQEVCCEFLRRQLDPSNCLGIRAFADTHACRELVRSADKYTQHNFTDVASSEEFLLLPVEQLTEIIASEELNVQSEEQVFFAVISWLLEHVRLPLCAPKFIVSVVGEDALVRSDAQSRDLVDEAKNYLLLPLERPNMQGPRTRPRKPLKYGEVLYAVGGWCSGDAMASVERVYADRSLPVWQCVAPMSKRRCGVGVAVVDDLLYAVGGHDGQSYLNSIERYDPKTNQWSSDVAPTSTCRTSVGVAVLDGLLYAVGGQDGVSCLNIVERYDARQNTWQKVAPMSTRRLGVSVCVLNGCLYAVGGSDGQNPLNTVERYDPRMNKWTVVRPMCTRRKHLGAAVYRGLIYAVGGRDDSCELSSAERYNPATNEWTAVVAMNNRRSGVGLAVVNDRLYAVGGFDGSSYLKSVEVYDPDANQWRHHGSMNYRRLGGGVAVIREPQNEVNYKLTRSGNDPPGFVDPQGFKAT